jgi:GTP-binding protein YchF
VRDVAIVGVPYSGKSTLFTALTRAGSVGGRSNQAVVDVPDARLAPLAQLERSRKVVPAKLRFVDVPGGLTAQAIAAYREADALCLVVRAFGSDAEPQPERRQLETELLLADLVSIEGGLERARKRARSSPEGRAEVEALEAARAALDAGRPLRGAPLDDATGSRLKSFGLLTLKPWIVVANVAEDESTDVADEDVIPISAVLEAEIAALEETEAAELRTGFGVERPGLERVVEACYRALDLVTFLTTGEDETRAWQVRRGARAPEAAGVIHSDMERGFIRAEVVSYDDLVAAGSWAAAKSLGRLRVEGKDYVVREGDVMHVRFAV